MSNNSGPLLAHRSRTAAMIVFATAFGLHGIDHLRRGMSASPPSIMVGGMIQGFFVVVAMVLVLVLVLVLTPMGFRIRVDCGFR